VLLFTNSPAPEAAGVRVLPFGPLPALPAHLYLQRIENALRVPTEEYDAVLQMDLDMLAAGSLAPFFVTGRRLWVAPSNLPLLHAQHARYFLGDGAPLRRRLAAWFRRREMGVSACLAAARGDRWRTLMGRWAELIEATRARWPDPPLGDQTVLNLARLERRLPLAVFRRDQVLHRDWSLAGDVRILHFAGCGDREAAMQAWSRAWREGRRTP
jgi:hypothetical protein